MSGPSIRTAHGTSRRIGKLAVVENDPRELPQGIARPEPARSGDARDERGRFKADGARACGRAGGRARKGFLVAADALGLGTVVRAPGWAPYGRMARGLAKAHVGDLARLVGGGEVPAMLRSEATAAALLMMASRWAFDRASALVDAPDTRIAAHLFAESARWSKVATSKLATLHALAAKMAPPKRTGGSVAELRARIGGGQ